MLVHHILMTLKKYMHTHSISDMKIAEKLGVTRQSVYGWRNGKAPKDAMKKEIYLLTGGKVTIASWFED